MDLICITGKLKIQSKWIIMEMVPCRELGCHTIFQQSNMDLPCPPNWAWNQLLHIFANTNVWTYAWEINRFFLHFISYVNAFIGRAILIHRSNFNIGHLLIWCTHHLLVYTSQCMGHLQFPKPTCPQPGGFVPRNQ
jgi:hypothetical protein